VFVGILLGDYLTLWRIKWELLGDVWLWRFSGGQSQGKLWLTFFGLLILNGQFC